MNKNIKNVINTFPKEVQDFIGFGTIKEISIGRSGDYVYEIIGVNSFILKISIEIERLEYEKNIFQWLKIDNKLPVPEVLLWYKTNDKGYLITKKIKGKMACEEYFIKRPLKLISICNDAVQMMRKVELKDFPYPTDLSSLKNKSFSHGDLCLPNIIIRNNNIVGFLDLGDASIRDFEYDIATILRSYEYNIGSKKYSDRFIDFINTNSKNKINIEYVMKYYPDVFG